MMTPPAESPADFPLHLLMILSKIIKTYITDTTAPAQYTPFPSLIMYFIYYNLVILVILVTKLNKKPFLILDREGLTAIFFSFLRLFLFFETGYSPVPVPLSARVLLEDFTLIVSKPLPNTPMTLDTETNASGSMVLT